MGSKSPMIRLMTIPEKQWEFVTLKGHKFIIHGPFHMTSSTKMPSQIFPIMPGKKTHTKWFSMENPGVAVSYPRGDSELENHHLQVPAVKLWEYVSCIVFNPRYSMGMVYVRTYIFTIKIDHSCR